jgi:Lon protease-like protein
VIPLAFDTSADGGIVTRLPRAGRRDRNGNIGYARLESFAADRDAPNAWIDEPAPFEALLCLGLWMTAVRVALAIVTLLLFLVPASAPAQSAPPPVRGADALPSTIPIFPLDDVMVFPDILRPLHIFEPRYRTMVTDALKGDRVIGMIQLRPGYEANYEGRPPVFQIGCAGVIDQVEQLPDGRYNIVLRGLVKFRILSEDPGRPYRVARVEAILERPGDQERDALRKQRERLVALLPSGSELPPDAVPDEDVINALAQHLPIGPLRRQELLELEGPLSRSEALITLLQRN